MKIIYRQILWFFGGAFLLFVFGSILGLVIGMTIGGNYPPAFVYGGLPGYEGLGLLGSILGSYVGFFFWIDQRLDGRLRSWSRTSLLCCLIFELILQDTIARRNGVGVFWPMFVPFVFQGLIFLKHFSVLNRSRNRG